MISRIICFFLIISNLFGYSFSFQKTFKDAEYSNNYEKVERDMSKYVGVHSEVKDCGGVPALFVNGEKFSSVAYMTYLEKFNKYDEFVEAGYNFFSVPVLFTGKWISITDGFKPFNKGIFDVKNQPDYSAFDNSIKMILEQCPNAYIIPRVNISMPDWWINENPTEVNIKSDGTVCRESFYSEKWRKDASEMLREFIDYVNHSKYASHIIGYHIAGGNTEEWFHFDMNAGYCDNAKEGFKKFLEQYYPYLEYTGLPDFDLLNKKTDYFNNEYLTRYLEYASYAVADAITYFSKVVKEETGNNVVVGAFYGYTVEVTSSFHGTHALNVLLNDKNIDFICSPNSYIGVRNPDSDWTEMYPADSVRLHGKMCFQECDIRTHNTVLLNEKDPLTDPNKNLYDKIWQGLENKEQALNMLRKSFSRQLIKGNGLWWFDMWGGWYSDEDIMSEMSLYKKEYSRSLNNSNRKSVSELAVFVDESAYKYMTNNSHRNMSYNQRHALGLIGTSYDIYDISDFNSVYQKYKAVIFLSDTKTDYLKNSIRICKKSKTPYLMLSSVNSKFTVKELKAFCSVNNIYHYIDSEDIIYINNNYFAVYALTSGNKIIKLKDKYKITSVISNETVNCIDDKLSVAMNKGDTFIFRIEKSN